MIKTNIDSHTKLLFNQKRRMFTEMDITTVFLFTPKNLKKSPYDKKYKSFFAYLNI